MTIRKKKNAETAGRVERKEERAELRMAVGADVRKLTSRSHLELESIVDGTYSPSQLQGLGQDDLQRPFPSLDTTRTHNTLQSGIHKTKGRIRPVVRATKKRRDLSTNSQPITTLSTASRRRLANRPLVHGSVSRLSFKFTQFHLHIKM